MGRFVYSMKVSVDLRIEQVSGDNGAGDWLRIDEELHREFNAQARALALMVQGRVIGGDDAIGQLAALRAGTDGPIGVGGAALATQLLRAKLLDELVLCTRPTIRGFGRPPFDDYDLPIDLDLLEQRSFEQGVTMHRYAIRDDSEVSPC